MDDTEDEYLESDPKHINAQIEMSLSELTRLYTKLAWERHKEYGREVAENAFQAGYLLAQGRIGFTDAVQRAGSVYPDIELPANFPKD